MSMLSTYSGEWNSPQIKQLLNRTLFGYTKAQWNEWAGHSMETLLHGLLEDKTFPDPPLNNLYNGDPHVPLGKTWVHAPHTSGDEEIRKYRLKSLIQWVLEDMVERNATIYHKMILFWHNHFPINKIGDRRFNYDYYKLLHEHALGNFRTLTKKMTIHPAMLRYLNGNRNTSRSPNENYARELLELFTIGKGPQVAEGDYTNYTEQDVRAIARCLTGWKDYGFMSEDGPDYGSHFRSHLHDKSVKKLSGRFEGAQIPNLEEEEYARVIDIIFEKKEVARFICRKLFRWYVGAEIDDTVEQELIHPLAEILYENDYEIKPVLAALLASEVFYDEKYRGAIIKNPLEFLLPMYRQMHFNLEEESEKYFHKYISVYYFSIELGLKYFNIPQVAGWKAYYQEPAWYQHWISTTTLGLRNEASQRLLSIRTRYNGSGYGADILELLQDFEYPHDPNELVREMTLYMLPKPLTDDQIMNLKEYFIPGLPDYEWTAEYNAYLKNPTDQKLKRALNEKLKTLVYYVMSLPDYQIF